MTTPRPLATALQAAPVAVRQIPVVDFQPFHDHDHAQRVQTGLALAQALRDSGFAYLTGHQVPQALIDQAFAQAQRLFALPEQVKAEIAAAPREG